MFNYFNYFDLVMRASSLLAFRWYFELPLINKDFTSLHNHHAEQIGGPGMTVQIDESNFGKTKSNRGRYIEGQWLFGGIIKIHSYPSFEPTYCRVHAL